jgi:hypothetical protein
MNVTRIAEYRRREGYRIVITPGWHDGFDVTVEPPTETHPLRRAKTYDEAMALALAIQKAEGWPLFSYAGDEPTGGDAA